MTQHAAIHRLATRYLLATNLDPSEVLGVRIEGAEISKHVDEFTRLLIQEGQRINHKVEAAIKEVEGYYPPDKIDRKELRMAVMKHLDHLWGRDAMTPLLARMIVNGEFVS